MQKKGSFSKCFLTLVVAIVITFTGCFTEEFKASGPLPEFSPVGGFYKEAQSVQIDSNMENVKIYYTTDGTTPTESSILYSGAVEIDSECIIRAMAVSGEEIHYAMTAYDFDFSADIKKHKKSPNWQNQVIYFAMLDRFADGDSSINIQGAPQVENFPERESNFSGGDLQGLIDKINDGYFTELGITAIWTTPPVRNQWHEGNYGGFHGYWASDFTDVDPHFGDIEKYKEYVQAAHAKGIYVIQDLVLNHVGDYFTIMNNQPYLYGADNWILNGISLPTSAPEQLPWSLNDPSILTQEEFENNSFYHWFPAITDYNDRSQIFNNQLSNLDDLNTDNPVVKNLLMGYSRFWIDKVDIDAYRVDTVKYINPEFFEEYTNSTDEKNPGIREYAKRLGKEDFIMFGECWDGDESFVASYTQSEDGKPRLDSMIYFPLANATRSVFGSGNRTSELTQVLNNRYNSGLYANPEKLVTFIDNHDMPRFRALTGVNLTKAAYAFIMTIPGIPQIYYGAEQDFITTRRAMFAGGYRGPNMPVNDVDHYDRSSDMYVFLKDIIKLRKKNKVFREGRVTVVKDNENSNGLFAYKVIKGNGGRKKEAFVIFNTSSNRLVASNMQTGLTPGSIFKLKNPSLGVTEKTLTVAADGSLSLIVPAESYGIYTLKKIGEVPGTPENAVTITSSFPGEISTSNITLEGTVTKTPATLKVIFDNKIDNALNINLADGSELNWSQEISLNSVSNGTHDITVAIENSDGTYNYSNSIALTIARSMVRRAYVVDPEGDDTGVAGHTYTIPQHASFDLHQQDIKNIEVLTAGPDIQIRLTMRGTSNIWSPTVNNFDHVVFGIFLRKSNSTSTVTAFPWYNYDIPFGWDYYSRQDGWSAFMTSSEGADAWNPGIPVSPAPTSVVDHENNIITFNITADSIGSPSSLNGWQIYIATWDNDSGNPRGLTPTGGDWQFGGGNGANGDPLVIDESQVITITIP